MSLDPEIIRVYTDEIIALSERLREPRRLADPKRSAKAVSPICGSIVEADVRIENGKISALGFAVEACALTRAAAAIVMDAAPGASLAEVRAGEAEMEDMLSGSGAPPQTRWSPLKILAPVRDYPARHNALLLPFEAVLKAL